MRILRRAFSKAAAAGPKYEPSPNAFIAPSKLKRQVIIIGSGHNGLVTAAYLAKAGLDVLVLERRHLIGGAAVTEEIIPGFHFSRASYLAGLLRPQIIEDLQLEHYGFEYLPRSPSSFTPSLPSDPILQGRSLLLGATEKEDLASIAQFSQRDAEMFPKYEEFLHKVRQIVNPLLDSPPPDILDGNFADRFEALKTIKDVSAAAISNRDVAVNLYELFTGPATQLLNRWFDSDILKTTLATDAVIGSMSPPTANGSAYVLLHHVMGSAAGRDGIWAYVRGGMGRVSQAIASSARKYGAEIVTNATVKNIIWKEGKCVGVEMADGTKIESDIVISNATPFHTYTELLPKDGSSPLPKEFVRSILTSDYSCGAFKINCAVSSLPDFLCTPNDKSGAAGPQHRGTIHFETKMEEIEIAARQAGAGIPPDVPVIEMTIPSVYDATVAPEGKHVIQLFVQFAPYHVDPKYGHWDDGVLREKFADKVFARVDQLAPGFSSSVIGRDILSPRDLERIFGLHEGNIMHGSLGIHQLMYCRPSPGYSQYQSPLSGLYLCGAGTHPGGGVMGAAGRNCARKVLRDLGKKYD